jgi:hypothetical protein
MNLIKPKNYLELHIGWLGYIRVPYDEEGLKQLVSFLEEGKRRWMNAYYEDQLEKYCNWCKKAWGEKFGI